MLKAGLNRILCHLIEEDTELASGLVLPGTHHNHIRQYTVVANDGEVYGVDVGSVVWVGEVDGYFTHEGKKYYSIDEEKVLAISNPD